MSVRIRRNVWELEDGDQTLHWYSRAIEHMRELPFSDPMNWYYLASVHGHHPAVPIPATESQFLNQCQHQTWYFIPWHRGYLAAMEAMVSKVISDLGGPADWALPYWNYSQDLTENPNARLMPPAFRNQLKDDGTENFLWAPRRTVVNGDFDLDDDVVSLDALEAEDFVGIANGIPEGFGGPQTGFNHGGGPNGALENIPHNIVHVRINGFMINPATAAIDPIFWLHHCNIDRLWQVWLNQGAQYANPTDPQWLTGQSFVMHDGNGAEFSFTCEEMIDTRNVLHGYDYDTMPAVPEGGVVVAGTQSVSENVVPELIGASDVGIDLNEKITRTTVTLQAIQDTGFSIESVTNNSYRSFLSLENVTGTGLPGDYVVFIDIPNDDQPALKVGILTTFGVARASDVDQPHGGNGISQVFEISKIADRLNIGPTQSADIEVSFERIDLDGEIDAIPESMSMFINEEDEPTVKVGRVSIYFQ